MSLFTKRGFSRCIFSPRGFSIATACSLAFAGAAQADAQLDEPLSLSERSPLVQRFNLPGMRSGQLLAAGDAQWRFGADLSNNYVRDSAGAEALIFDGELQRYEWSVRYGLGAQWEIGMMLPWMTYRGGVLDSFINRWHSVWGLPDHDRADYPSDRLRFVHASRGQIDFEFSDAQSGMGDVQLQIARQIVRGERVSAALIAHVNLPSGDDDKLTGSGGSSGGVTLAATRSGWLDLPLTLNANIGVQSLPDNAVLDDRQKSSVWFGGGEIAWTATPDWRLRMQVNAHSAIYDSALAALGEASTQLLLGGTLRLDAKWALDIALSEDIVLDTAPDITLQLALKGRL